MIAGNRLVISHLVNCTQHLDAVLQDMDLQIGRIQAFMSAHEIPLVDLGGDGMDYSDLHGFTVSPFPVESWLSLTNLSSGHPSYRCKLGSLLETPNCAYLSSILYIQP